MNLVKDFLDSSLRNTWIEYDGMKVFVRKARHMTPDHKLVYCFDIANVTVYMRGVGTFSHWLKEVIELARERGFEAVFVESVINQRFVEYFRKLEWVEVEGPDRNFFYF